MSRNLSLQKFGHKLVKLKKLRNKLQLKQLNFQICKMSLCLWWVYQFGQNKVALGSKFTSCYCKFLPPISLRPVLILPSCLHLSPKVTYSLHVLRPKFCIHFTYVITDYKFTKHASFAYYCSDGHKRMEIQYFKFYWFVDWDNVKQLRDTWLINKGVNF